MKKTIIAAAIATVVAAPAMADVSVSGAVKLTIADIDDDTNNYGPSFNGSQLSFKASEDLGNGLTAFAETTLNTDGMNNAADTANAVATQAAIADTTVAGAVTAQTAANAKNANFGQIKDMKLGVKGGFGTIVAGRMETLTEGAVSSMMDDGASTHAASTQLESGLTGIGRVNAVAYVSPTVNGFHAAVAGTLNSADDSMFQHVDIAAVYANGPLTVKASRVDFDGTDNNVTAIGASYAMGDAKVSAMRTSADAGAATNALATSADDTMLRLDYKMGNNSILLATKDSDVGSDMNVIKLTHKMSKRTAVWIGHRDKDTAADVTHFGMIHKF